MCQDCQGLGTQYGANLQELSDLMQLSSIGLLRSIWEEGEGALDVAAILLAQERIDPEKPLNELSSKQLQVVLNGSQNWHLFDGLKLRFVGVNTILAKLGKNGISDIKESILPLLDEAVCPSCKGARINPLARHVTIHDLSIADFCALPIEKASSFLNKIKIPKEEKKVLDEVMQELKRRLSFLIEMGMQYLALNRRAPTLSGGEAQRIRLARQLGGGLTGVLYVLDEPTVGLHPKDNELLNQALLKLKNLGNTLVLVEHDPQTIALADKVIDFGPGSGELGGQVMAEGTLKELIKNKNSLTGQYLGGKKSIPIPETFRSLKNGKLLIKKAKLHNLQGINVTIPLSAFVCVTGVSGSGKSTLVQSLLLPALKKGVELHDVVNVNGHGTVEGILQVDKVLSIDQNPIGHTVRSDVSTYVDLLGPIRTLFSQLPQARTKGLEPRHFSTNHKKGMCTSCYGLGYKRVEMLFLPTVQVPCDQCHGLRLNPLSLEIIYHGKNLGQWLQQTVDQAYPVFSVHPKLKRILETLQAVGLGYLKLGQEMATLSGGEAQRIKLSRELSKRSTGKTVYLLDEPTTGLHPDDIVKLLRVLHALVDKGNTVIVIEHHLDVIKNSDYIIDLGPGAGDAGGKLLYQGPLAGLGGRGKEAGKGAGLKGGKAKGCEESVTAKYL
jgi:excinuclease ABC subunit A